MTCRLRRIFTFSLPRTPSALSAASPPARLHPRAGEQRTQQRAACACGGQPSGQLRTGGMGPSRAAPAALLLLLFCSCLPVAEATIAYDIEKPWRL